MPDSSFTSSLSLLLLLHYPLLIFSSTPTPTPPPPPPPLLLLLLLLLLPPPIFRLFLSPPPIFLLLLFTISTTDWSIFLFLFNDAKYQRWTWQPSSLSVTVIECFRLLWEELTMWDFVINLKGSMLFVYLASLL